jgi:hypothetical protein
MIEQMMKQNEQEDKTTQHCKETQKKNEAPNVNSNPFIEQLHNT